MLTAGPRVVWFHWMQGRAAMPPVPAACLASWERRNPDWEVVFVDGDSVWQYLDRAAMPVDALLQTSPQVYANAVRLKLLATHGGLWADATTWCVTPLSDWLTGMPGGFFAFAAPAPDRLLSNWFLAAERNSYLVATLAEAYIGVFRRFGPLTLMPEATVDQALAGASSTDVLVEPVLNGDCREYPYYFFHYLFAHLCRRDDRFRSIWEGSGRLSADASHDAQRLDLTGPADASIRQRLDAIQAHVHKLVWKIDPIPPGSVLDAIVTGQR